MLQHFSSISFVGVTCSLLAGGKHTAQCTDFFQACSFHVQVRTIIQQGFKQALEGVDVLVGPAAPTTAFELGSVINDPLTMYKNDVLTVSLNLAGEKGGQGGGE